MRKEYKSGFVALVGRPNVGKSSLLNTLIGQKIVITSDKPQTTRNQLRGILTTEDFQIVWIDTPGLHHPLHQLGERMNRAARTVLLNVDLVLWILDAGAGLTTADQKVAAVLRESDLPVLQVWNKVDLVEPEKPLPKEAGFDRVYKISALTGRGIPELLAGVVAGLPAGPAFYPPDQITDHPERFIAAEFVREQILQFTAEEIPHSVAVLVEEMKERANGKIYIDATIYVERDSQKGIVIGAKGERLKNIGQAARRNLELLLDAPVFLRLWVKVRKNWRNNEAFLREFGYWEEDQE
ncbi:MAG: GTPase Era [Bacillota bacterium]